jgi:serine/threonine-protein phosphatase PP1 catalytic subunit
MNNVFGREPAVIKVDINPIMIVGDLHDNLIALEYVLQKKKETGCRAILFLGDYVDRGIHGSETLVRLFKLKIKDPHGILMLRGNHEDINMNVDYGFYNEIHHDDDLLLKLDNVYNKMPAAAVLSNYAFCVHGGINIPEPISRITKSNAYLYMWNDPSDRPSGGLRPSSRGAGIHEFGADVVSKFLKMNNLRLIIRGHTALRDGYHWWFDKQLLSLFSSPNYCGDSNSAAYAIFNNGNIKVHTFTKFSSAPKSGSMYNRRDL